MNYKDPSHQLSGVLDFIFFFDFDVIMEHKFSKILILVGVELS